MSTALEAIKGHWAKRRNGMVHVPEWEMDVHFTRITVDEQRKLGINAENAALVGIKLLIAKAVDADGKRLFDDEPATLNTLLYNADPNVVLRLVNEIAGVTAERDAAKN